MEGGTLRFNMSEQEVVERPPLDRDVQHAAILAKDAFEEVAPLYLNTADRITIPLNLATQSTDSSFLKYELTLSKEKQPCIQKPIHISTNWSPSFE